MTVSTADTEKISPQSNAAKRRTKTRSVVPHREGLTIPQNERALRQLTDLCVELGPGNRLPLHTELMQRFEVSERAILRALDELQRAGSIIRRPGLGTIIAEPITTVRSISEGDDSHYGVSSVSDISGALHSPAIANRTIIAIAQTDHSFYERFLDLLCVYAEDEELSVFCKPLRVGEDPTLESLGLFIVDPGLCRFIVFSYQLYSLAKRLQDRGAQVVLVGTPSVGAAPELPCVYGNQERGGYLMTQHLIEIGHLSIGFVHDNASLLESPRWQGHQRALRDARRRGIAVRDTFLQGALREWEADPSKAADLLRAEGSPTALITWNDREAIILLSVLRRAGVRVPDDVSVCGYDDLPEAKTAYSPLTTVNPFADQQLRAAVDLLSQSDDTGAGKRTPPTTTVVVPALVTRESTAAPRTSSFSSSLVP